MTLRDIRLESGIKADKIAKEIGISRVQLYNLENGLYKISESKIEKFCEIYKKDKEEIITAIKDSEGLHGTRSIINSKGFSN